MKLFTTRPAAREMSAAPISGARGGGRWTRLRRQRVVAASAIGACLLAVAGTSLAGAPAAGAATETRVRTGFSVPFSGPPRYEYLAPGEARNPSDVNMAIGQTKADEIARQMGLRKELTFSNDQYLAFISGGGVGGDQDAAKLVNDSVAILTNTIGRPLISQVDGVPTPSVLASYGLFVNPNGLLESVANMDAATRQVNTVIAPGPNGYMGKWMRQNGATKSLINLYRSIYPLETFYGYLSQQASGAAQLITNTKGRTSSQVGMSMGPALWLTNFALIYTLNPTLAAYMPAYWAPIPITVAQAILASPTGQVEYSDYKSAFPSS